jgi:hypothetical protein
MAKYFCPDCKKVTFSLRYMTKSVWHTVNLQWCNYCTEPKPTKDCIKGLAELQKKPSKHSIPGKINFLSKIFQENWI